MKIIRFICSFIFISFISACSDKFSNESYFLDFDWRKDLYNIVFSSFNNIDDLKFKVIDRVYYVDGSPFQQGCIEVWNEPGKYEYYIINYDLYFLEKTISCDDGNGKGKVTLIEKSNEIKNIVDFDNVNKENKIKEHSDNFIKYFDSNNEDIKERNNKFLKYLDNKQDKLTSYLIFSELFPVNKVNITDNGKKLLLSVIKELSLKNVSEITIYGIADSSGDYLLNKELADMRASSIYHFLVDNGVVDIPIKIKGSVENSEKTKQGRELQRRFLIEVKLKNE